MKKSIVELLNELNMSQDIKIKCKTLSQLKALKEIQNSFASEGVKELQLIKNGIRLTDSTGAQADFIYDFKKEITVCQNVGGK